MIVYTQTAEEAIELELDFTLKFRKTAVPWVVAALFAMIGAVSAAFVCRYYVLIGFAIIFSGGAAAIVILQLLYPRVFRAMRRRQYAAERIPPVYDIQIEKNNDEIFITNLSTGKVDFFPVSDVKTVMRRRQYIYVEVSLRQSLLFPNREDIYEMLCPTKGTVS